MKLDYTARNSNEAPIADSLAFLLKGVHAWQQLDKAIKRIVPPNLHAYFQTACIEQGGCLVLTAHNNMAASRLKMLLPSLLPQLQNISPHIQTVRVKLIPQPPIAAKQNQLQLNETALHHLQQTANRVRHHHELAQALDTLIARHQNP